MQCLVCCDGVESSSVARDDGSVKKCQDLYKAFSKYLNLRDEYRSCFDFRRELFPFCRYCKLMLTQLLQLHEQSEYLSKLMTQISAQLSSMILESVGKEERGAPGEDGSGRSKRRKVGNENPNLTKIVHIRQAVTKQFGATLNLVMGLDSQLPVKKSLVKRETPMKADNSVSEDYGFALGPVSDDLNENEDFGDQLSPESYQDNNESQDSAGMDSDDPDYKLPEFKETPAFPVVMRSRNSSKILDKVKEIGENKFLYEDQIPFEILDGAYKCGACVYMCNDRRDMLCVHIPKEHLGAEGERVPLTKKLDDNKFIYREKYPFELVDDVYHCGTCTFTSNRKDGIQAHIKVRHFIGVGRKHRQFNLEELEPGKFIYADKYTFQQIEGGFKCDTCQSTKERRVKMLLHLRSVHMEPLTVHSCDKCGKIFRERRKLLQHNATHSEDRPFVCDICNKGFKLQIVLHTHKKKHLGEDAKKHVCDMCGKRFWNNFLLKEHMTTHTGEKVFECPVCLKTFARNATRKLHMELHNLEKAFMCELCGRSYSSQIHLNRHIASHKRDRKRKRKTIIKKEESEAVPQEVEIEATNIVEDFLEL